MTQHSSPVTATSLPFQKRVLNWLMECFSMDVCRDGTERNHRFLEEALELVQALGCTRSEAHQLVDYVFGRPAGEPRQELGGVMVTVSALASCHDMDLSAAGETELARVWTKIDKIRAKQAAKPKHSPLPEHMRVPAQQPASPVTEQLFQSCLSELTEGHLALDRLGAPREVQEGDVIRECLIAERISSVAQRQPEHGSLESILDSAMAWQPTESGPSYTEKKEDLWRRLCALIPAQTQPGHEVISDISSHLTAWKQALEASRDHALRCNDSDDAAFWRHEIVALDRALAHAQAPLWEGSPQWQFVQRLQAYLDDAPADGRHSDAGGGNAYDLIEEAIGWMTPSVPSTNNTMNADDKMLAFFMEAARIQALIHTGQCEHGVKVGNTCPDCLGAAVPPAKSSDVENKQGGAS